MTIDRAATTLDHPEITVSKPPADSSGKVGVINQKLTNFNTMQSMTKFVDGNFREKYNAENDKKCANAIQQSTTYISSRSSELGKILQRETDSNFAWFDPGEVHRSERIMMKFAARDSDVAAHYHRYTSPRHCYRLPPRIKQPFLESCALNRNIGVSTRAIADFAPRNSKPPVREPNMPKKREKDEKKDKKEKKKPVIRTDGESADSSENRAEMIANDNPKSDPGFHEWGVKLAEEPAAEASDNDNLAEKSRRYVTKQFWGVNLKQAKPDVEDVPSPASEGPRRAAEEHRNTSPISESSDIIVDETRSNASSSLNASTKVSDASNLKGTTAEYLSTPSYQANLISPSSDSIMPQQGKTDSSLNSEALQRIMKASPDVLKEPITIDEEYNVPEGATLNTEITAWKILAMRSNTVAQEDHMSPDNVENMEMVSIRPEAPQPKLDVRVVKSTEDALEDDQEIDQTSSGYKAVKPTKIKHFGSSQKPDSYVSSKRLHTASMQIRYTHRYIATLSINSVLIDKTTRMKCSRFTSAFSTNPENSKEIIKTLNQQGKEKLDSKSWTKEERSNDSNNSLSIKRPHLPFLESRTFSNSSKKPSDTDNLAETLNVIANKEMEISLKESQTTDHRKKIARLSSEPAQKDESRFKDEDVQDEIERYENSTASYIDSRKDATYIDFETPSADPGDPIKSPNAKLNEEDSKSNVESDKNATLNPNVEDAKDEYIVDGDYVRFPGDPYPYNKENLDKWRESRSFHRPVRPINPETKFDSVSVTRSRNTNDNVYANVSRDSHAAAMKTSGSGDGAGAKNAGHSGSGFHRVSPRSQRAVSDCLRGDAADALGLRGWTEAFSRLDVGGEMDEAAVRGGGGGDDASSRVYHQ